MPRIILSAAEPPLRNVEKLFSIPALSDIGDQIEYLPPTDFGNGTTQFSEKPIETAFFEFVSKQSVYKHICQNDLEI